MKYALVNPRWSFDGSVYFGCREPHLPLEYGYARELLRRAGHEVLLVDGTLEALAPDEIRRRVEAFRPDLAVITTAPSYLFWRCAPPELRVPKRLARELWAAAKAVVAVGPHGSTTPETALEKLDVDAVVLGECEEILPRLATEDWTSIPSLCVRGARPRGGPAAANMAALPALRWEPELLRRHAHQHHRFDAPGRGLGAELEASRGCPYHCSFCAKENFRDVYRKRPLATVLEELDGLIAQGVEYVYFVDEILLPDRALLEALAERPIKFGVQTRLDLWKPEMIDLLARAGCVSIEAGVESVTPEGRAELDKNCRLSTGELTERLLRAKRAGVAFVQGNLIESKADDPAEIAAWRAELRTHGVWSNDPVPLFPYPGSPDYRKRWGLPDRAAWERAHEHYLGLFDRFSDVQDGRPLPLPELERDGGDPRRPLSRVLLVADAVGGVWTFSLELARVLRERGVGVDLAVLGPPLRHERRREARAIEGLELHELPACLEWMENPWSDLKRAAGILLDLEARVSPDVVHLNAYSLAAEPWRAPRVVTGHSCVLSWWRAVRGGDAPAEWDAYRRAVAEGLASADALAAPSRFMLSELERLYPRLPRLRAVVLNGRSGGADVPKDELILGAGRFWDEAKNVDVLARAARGLPWPVALAGEAGGRTVSPDVRLLGRLEPDELQACYERAAIFAHPARYEPFGLAPLEAALSGCALVLGDIPSLREIWDDAALYVPPEDVDALHRALRGLIEDPGAREAWGRRARARARRFTPERMAAGYLDLYAEARKTEDVRCGS